MTRPIPTKPSIRQAHRSVRPRPSWNPDHRYEPPLDSIRYNVRLWLAYVKLGFIILGAIAVVVIFFAFLVQFIWASWPLSFICFALIGVMVWFFIKELR